MEWYQKDIQESLEELGTSLAGLSSVEAERRRAQYGPNELKEKKKKSALSMFLDQFRDFMIIVLIAAAVISGIIGELSDTVAIIVIVILNAVIGFIQEYRAEKAMAALKRMAAPAATIIRDGAAKTVSAVELVPGDVVLLETGRVVPADLRLTEVAHLRVEEAALTGESLSVEKHADTMNGEMVPLGDRRNMAYKGTMVSYGRGAGLVVATGMDTELGRIAAMLQEEEEVRTPLQKRLEHFGRRLALAVLAICGIILCLGILRGEPPVLMLLTAVSLAVAAIPEALPAVITISLALGAQKMVRQNALVRRLPAVETLGSVTFICTDKTGTLTLNRMSVEELYMDGKVMKEVRGQGVDLPGEKASDPLNLRSLESLFFGALALCNDARIDTSDALIGDPTETALLRFARDKGFESKDLDKRFPRCGEIPFDADRKCMTTFHPDGHGNVISFTKGAFEVLLDKSGGILTSEGVTEINREELHTISNRMAADGLRILGIAMKRWETAPDMKSEAAEENLTLLGLVGIMDPPRPEARDAVAVCKMAGIRPVMITGDHPLTARVIARRLGILDTDDVRSIITGREMERLSLQELEERVGSIDVYARVAPEQKLRIVKALQEKGQFVAMTGDGVNDAPALKRADIGVAMGITGTDVAKEAAHMILVDDNFATIIKAVREGRRIYDNIRKFVKYLLTTNSGELWTLFLAPLVGLPIPLLPIHILWINLLTDGLPALALSAEPAECDVMKRPPRHPRESIFAHGLGLHALWVGLLMAAVTLSVQAWALRSGDVHWQTMVFTVLCLTQLGHVLAIRSERESFFTMGAFSNKPLLGAVLLSLVLQITIVYVPALNQVFKTAPLPPRDLIITLTLSSVIFLAVEVEKLMKRSFKGPSDAA